MTTHPAISLPAPVPWGSDGLTYTDLLHQARPPRQRNPQQLAPTIAAMLKLARDAALQHPDNPPNGLSVLDLDLIMNPWEPLPQRMTRFTRLLVPAIQRGALEGLTTADTDAATLQDLLTATYGWGAAVQALVDDPTITEIKINGTTVMASGAHSLQVQHQAYQSTWEPLSRAEFLAQSLGVTWNTSMPSVTLPLHGMRVHVSRSPRIVATSRDDPGLLIVMRRGRRDPWTMTELIDRGMLDPAAAALLVHLMTAQISGLICGEQDSGKTTLLECLINTIPHETHIVVIEDNTDEFTLTSPLITRVRIDDSQEDATSDRVRVVRETLRMTPGMLIVGEIRGDEAGPVLQLAEGGRPTFTTIHARDIPAALTRFARLAAAERAGNSFARQKGVADQVLASTLHLVILTSFSRRVQRRIVQDVALLDGLDVAGQPVLLPLITAQVSPTDAVTWTCHAAIGPDGHLVWHDPAVQTPLRVARAVSDLPPWVLDDTRLAGRSPHRPPPAPEAPIRRADMLQRARTALHDGRWEDAVQDLTLAARTGGYDRVVMTLAEHVLTRAPHLATAARQTIQADVAAIHAALGRWDVATADRLVHRVPATILIDLLRDRESAWAAAQESVATLQTQIALGAQDLRTAQALRQRGDDRGALAQVRAYQSQSLPPDLARQILQMRQAVLTRLMDQASDPAVRQQYDREQQQTSHDLAALAPSAAASGMEQGGAGSAQPPAAPTAGPVPASDAPGHQSGMPIPLEALVNLRPGSAPAGRSDSEYNLDRPSDQPAEHAGALNRAIDAGADEQPGADADHDSLDWMRLPTAAGDEEETPQHPPSPGGTVLPSPAEPEPQLPTEDRPDWLTAAIQTATRMQPPMDRAVEE